MQGGETSGNSLVTSLDDLIPTARLHVWRPIGYLTNLILYSLFVSGNPGDPDFSSNPV
jgi:hypothetical protein